MVSLIKYDNRHGLEVWRAYVIDRATKAVMYESMFLSELAARAWCVKTMSVVG